MRGPNAMFRYPKDVNTFAFDWGKLALTVAPEVNGAERFSGGVVDLGPGQGHTRHNHPGAEEIIFVISGDGEQMVEDEQGNPVVRQVGPGVHRLRSGEPFSLNVKHGDHPDAAFRCIFARRTRGCTA